MDTKYATISPQNRAAIISEALPYLRRLHGQTIVIKYGGAAQTDDALRAATMRDVALLHYVGILPVVVHGGGNEISGLCRELGIEPKFVEGMRVTDEATMRATEMVMGQIGKNIAQHLNAAGAPAVGLSGKDADLLRARQIAGDWGLVGEIENVNTRVLQSLLAQGLVPVVTPIAPGAARENSSGETLNSETFNINADLAAAAIAVALRASKLLLLTDVPGIYRDFQDKTSLLSRVAAREAVELISSGAVSRGMIPKVRCCIQAVQGGVERAHIVDGRAPHAILTELFTDEGCGTMIEKENEAG